MNIQIIYLILSFIFTAYFGKIIIPILKKLKVGQSEREDGPRSHLRKQGTPTMGGIIMMITIVVFTAIISICIKDKEITKTILILSISSLGFGIVGFIDDFKKVILHNTEGLNP
jgi:phospho-N-acetylmuramoyl-pentapeptide-transferase